MTHCLVLRGGMHDHTATADGVFDEPGAVRFTRVLPHAMERVWASLTESARRRNWLARGRMELYLGGRVELRFRQSELARRAETVPEQYRRLADGVISGRVTRCEPPRILSYTWGEGAHPSLVTFALAARPGAVLLVLTHQRAARAHLAGIAAGWHTHLDLLADYLDDFPSKPFWATHAKWEKEYARRLAGAERQSPLANAPP